MNTPVGQLNAPGTSRLYSYVPGRLYAALLGSGPGVAIGLFLAAAAPTLLAADAAMSDMAQPAGKISYYRDIRPILQGNCQGCHQPAKAKGGYIMTHFKGLLAGGETEGVAVVPEH